MRTLALIFAVWVALSAPAFAKDNEIYDRIIKSGEIRCGYSLWQPLLFVDPNSKEIKGIFHDLMEEAGKRLGLKVVWQEEIGWGTVVESVKTGRVDMACAGYWLHPSRIKSVSYNAPLFYAPLYAWGRYDDTRTFKSLTDFNNDKLTIVQVDGGTSGQLIDRYMPKVKQLNLPENATNGDMIQSILTHKADFLVDDVTGFMAYNRENPNKLKILYDGRPFATFPATMLLPPEEPQLKDMIDGTFKLIELDGTLDTILERYGVDKVFLRNPQPTVR